MITPANGSTAPISANRRRSLSLATLPHPAAMLHHASTLQDLAKLLNQDGFAFVDGPAMAPLVGATGESGDWPAFAASWDRLEPDTYLAATGRHRRRRHAVFQVSGQQPPARQADAPHYQSPDYNTLQGGIERWFEPIEPAIADGPTMQGILAFARDFFGGLAPQVPAWHVETHQFRIEARSGEAGEPTPEGVHRDGVDFVLVLLVDRQNIERGTTTIHLPDGTLLGDFTLALPLDAALVDDARVCHGVTPVTPKDPALPAHRDVLVVTFKAI